MVVYAGDEDSGVEDGDDGLARGGGHVGVGGIDLTENGGNAVEAAEATLDVENLIGLELHGGLDRELDWGKGDGGRLYL